MTERPVFYFSVILLLLALALGAYLVTTGREDQSLSSLQIEELNPDRTTTGAEFDAVVTGAGFSSDMRLALSYDFGNSHALIGSSPSWGHIESLRLSGDYLFAVGNFRGLQIYDVNRPDDPQLVASLPLPDITWEVILQGGLAYVVSVKGGLHIVDVSNPRDPVLLSTYGVDGAQYWGIDIVDQYVYLACGDWGLRILDVSDPRRPRLRGATDTPGFARDVAVAGGVAYLAGGLGGLQVMHVADPAKPSHVLTLKNAENARALAVAGNLLYVTDAENKSLHIFDRSRPDSPIALSSLDNIPSNQLRVSDSVVYLAAMSAGVILVDAREPENPIRTGTMDTDGSARGLDLAKGLVYVADGRQGVKVLDPAAAAPQSFPFQVQTSGEVDHVAYQNGRLFAAVEDHGLQVFSTIDGNPTLVSAIAPGWRPEDVAVQGGEAYFAAGDSGLVIIDLESNRQLSRLTLAEPVNRLVLAGELAFVRGVADAVYLVDISEPANPRLAGSFPDAGDIEDLAANGRYLFLADVYRGLLVVDVSDPAAPRLAADGFELPRGVAALAADKDSLFVGGEDELLVYSLQNRPQLKARRKFPQPIDDVALTTHFAFVATADKLYVLDRQSALEVTDITVLPGMPISLALREGRLAVLMKNIFQIYGFTKEGRLSLLASQREVMPNWLRGAGMETGFLTISQSGNAYRAEAQSPLPIMPLFLPGRGINDVRGLALEDDRLYVADDGRLLHVLRMDRRLGLVRLGTLGLEKTVTSVDAQGGLVYVCTLDVITVFDARDPGNIRQIGKIAIEGKAAKISVQAGWAVVAAGQGSVQFLDLRNPARPRLAARVDLPWPQNRFVNAMDVAVSASGDFVYAACGLDGLMVIDVRDPLRPQVAATLDIKGMAHRVRVRGERAIIGSVREGLAVVDVSNPSSPVLVSRLATRRNLRDFVFFEDGVLIAERGPGIPFLPLPVELEKFRIADAESLRVRVPPIRVPGRYTLQAARGIEEASLPGVLKVEPQVKSGTPDPPRTASPEHRSH